MLEFLQHSLKDNRSFIGATLYGDVEAQVHLLKHRFEKFNRLNSTFLREETALRIMYASEEFIGDTILTPVMTDLPEVTWWEGDMTRLIRRRTDTSLRANVSRSTEIQNTFSMVTKSCSHEVPVAVESIFKVGFPEISQSEETAATILMRDREAMMAEFIFNSANYESSVAGGQRDYTATPTAKWTQTGAASNPFADIKAAIANSPVPPNIFVIGQQDWDQYLSIHPTWVQTILDAGGTPVTVRGRPTITPQQFREFFGCTVIFGTARVATVGETPIPARFSRSSVTPIWKNHAALLRVDPVASSRGGSTNTYGFFASNREGIISLFYDEPQSGTMGAIVVKTSAFYAPQVTCAAMGYLFQNVFAP